MNQGIIEQAKPLDDENENFEDISGVNIEKTKKELETISCTGKIIERNSILKSSDRSWQEKKRKSRWKTRCIILEQAKESQNFIKELRYQQGSVDHKSLMKLKVVWIRPWILKEKTKENKNRKTFYYPAWDRNTCLGSDRRGSDFDKKGISSSSRILKMNVNKKILKLLKKDEIRAK